MAVASTRPLSLRLVEGLSASKHSTMAEWNEAQANEAWVKTLHDMLSMMSDHDKLKSFGIMFVGSHSQPLADLQGLQHQLASQCALSAVSAVSQHSWSMKYLSTVMPDC